MFFCLSEHGGASTRDMTLITGLFFEQSNAMIELALSGRWVTTNKMVIIIMFSSYIM